LVGAGELSERAEPVNMGCSLVFATAPPLILLVMASGE
jgi:hypothetical protein